jgi:hypothetical protein
LIEAAVCTCIVSRGNYVFRQDTFDIKFGAISDVPEVAKGIHEAIGNDALRQIDNPAAQDGWTVDEGIKLLATMICRCATAAADFSRHTATIVGGAPPKNCHTPAQRALSASAERRAHFQFGHAQHQRPSVLGAGSLCDMLPSAGGIAWHGQQDVAWVLYAVKRVKAAMDKKRNKVQRNARQRTSRMKHHRAPLESPSAAPLPVSTDASAKPATIKRCKACGSETHKTNAKKCRYTFCTKCLQLGHRLKDCTNRSGNSMLAKAKIGALKAHGENQAVVKAKLRDSNVC